MLPQYHVKDPVDSAKSAGSRLQLNTHTPHICGFAWSDMVHGCMVSTELAPRWQQFHVAPVMQQTNYDIFMWILKIRTLEFRRYFALLWLLDLSGDFVAWCVFTSVKKYTFITHACAYMHISGLDCFNQSVQTTLELVLSVWSCTELFFVYLGRRCRRWRGMGRETTLPQWCTKEGKWQFSFIYCPSDIHR